MPKRSTVMSRIAAAALAIIAAVGASVAVAQAPAADALKQIIAEGREAYLNWPTALINRERIATLQEENGYRLLWSDGAQPTKAALDLIPGKAGRSLKPTSSSTARLWPPRMATSSSSMTSTVMTNAWKPH